MASLSENKEAGFIGKEITFDLVNSGKPSRPDDGIF
jgi:hypothetical protein